MTLAVSANNSSPPTSEILIPKLRRMADALHEHNTLVMMQFFTYGKFFGIPATNVDTVVIATGYLPNNSLYKELNGQIKELYAVGDCTVPRRVPETIHSAYLTAFHV